MTESPRVATRWFCACLVAVATMAVFWPVLGHDFVSYDDNTYVTHNPHVRQGLTLASLGWAWSSTYASNWHPLTWMSHMLDWELFGSDPLGHHLTSLLLHILNALLLFLAMERATGSVIRSAVVALLFSVHPLHVESVAWVAERKDLLAMSFWMLIVLSYLWYVRSRNPLRYLLVAFCLALGLCAKPMLVTAPLTLLLLDYWPLGRLQSPGGTTLGKALRLLYEKIPLLCLSIMSSAMTFIAQGLGNAVAPLAEIPLSERISNAIVAYSTYLYKTVWPTGLAFFYPHPRGQAAVWPVIVSAALLALVTFAAVRWRRRLPYLLVGWLWYLGTLVPVIGLVQVGEQARADRYTYVPLVGIFLIVVWLAADALGSRRLQAWAGRGARWSTARGSLLVLGVSAVAALMACASIQVRYWRDSVTLFERALAVTDHNFVAHYHLGLAFADLGRPEEAVRHYELALEDDPNWVEARNNLASALNRLGRTEEAMEHLRKAVEIRPDYAIAHYNLAVALFLKREYADARAEAELARRYGFEPPSHFHESLSVAESGPHPTASSPRTPREQRTAPAEGGR